jgi:hypothetical protein
MIKMGVRLNNIYDQCAVQRWEKKQKQKCQIGRKRNKLE